MIFTAEKLRPFTLSGKAHRLQRVGLQAISRVRERASGMQRNCVRERVCWNIGNIPLAHGDKWRELDGAARDGLAGGLTDNVQPRLASDNDDGSLFAIT